MSERACTPSNPFGREPTHDLPAPDAPRPASLDRFLLAAAGTGALVSPAVVVLAASDPIDDAPELPFWAMAVVFTLLALGWWRLRHALGGPGRRADLPFLAGASFGAVVGFAGAMPIVLSMPETVTALSEALTAPRSAVDYGTIALAVLVRLAFAFALVVTFQRAYGGTPAYRLWAALLVALPLVLMPFAGAAFYVLLVLLAMLPRMAVGWDAPGGFAIVAMVAALAAPFAIGGAMG